MNIPYPKSEVIKGIEWVSEPMLYPNSFGDVWSCTWADDNHIYTVSDDTTGIDKACESNLAVSVVRGSPTDCVIETINPMYEFGRHWWREGQDTWKAAGMTCVDGVLYMGVSQHSGAYDYPDLIQWVYDGSIVKSEDHGKTWSQKRRAGNAMFPGPRFATPFFVQFGKDYQGAFDEYVYSVSNGDTWNNGNYMMMARVHRDKIHRLDPTDWEFFLGTDEQNTAYWTDDIVKAHHQSKGIFRHRGCTSMTGIQYVPAVERFILAQWAYTYPDSDRPWDQTSLFLYEAPKPWGPWHNFHVEENWGTSYYNPSLPSKWFEEDGKKMWMVAAGNFQQTPGAPYAYGFISRKLSLLY